MGPGTRRPPGSPFAPLRESTDMSLRTYCQAVADGTLSSAGLRGRLRRAVCLLVRTHRAGVPF